MVEALQACWYVGGVEILCDAVKDRGLGSVVGLVLGGILHGIEIIAFALRFCRLPGHIYSQSWS